MNNNSINNSSDIIQNPSTSLNNSNISNIQNSNNGSIILDKKNSSFEDIKKNLEKRKTQLDEKLKASFKEKSDVKLIAGIIAGAAIIASIVLFTLASSVGIALVCEVLLILWVAVAVIDTLLILCAGKSHDKEIQEINKEISQLKEKQKTGNILDEIDNEYKFDDEFIDNIDLASIFGKEGDNGDINTSNNNINNKDNNEKTVSELEKLNKQINEVYDLINKNTENNINNTVIDDKKDSTKGIAKISKAGDFKKIIDDLKFKIKSNINEMNDPGEIENLNEKLAKIKLTLASILEQAKQNKLHKKENESLQKEIEKLKNKLLEKDKQNKTLNDTIKTNEEKYNENLNKIKLEIDKQKKTIEKNKNEYEKKISELTTKNQTNEEKIKKQDEEISDQKKAISEYEKINSEQKKKLDENKIEIENQNQKLLAALQGAINVIKGKAGEIGKQIEDKNNKTIIEKLDFKALNEALSGIQKTGVGTKLLEGISKENQNISITKENFQTLIGAINKNLKQYNPTENDLKAADAISKFNTALSDVSNAITTQINAAKDKTINDYEEKLKQKDIENKNAIEKITKENEKINNELNEKIKLTIENHKREIVRINNQNKLNIEKNNLMINQKLENLQSESQKDKNTISEQQKTLEEIKLEINSQNLKINDYEKTIKNQEIENNKIKLENEQKIKELNDTNKKIQLENEEKINQINEENKKIQLENEEKINQINEENKKNLEKINDQNNKISEYEKINSEQKKKLLENLQGAINGIKDTAGEIDKQINNDNNKTIIAGLFNKTNNEAIQALNEALSGIQGTGVGKKLLEGISKGNNQNITITDKNFNQLIETLNTNAQSLKAEQYSTDTNATVAIRTFSDALSAVKDQITTLINNEKLKQKDIENKNAIDKITKEKDEQIKEKENQINSQNLKINDYEKTIKNQEIENNKIKLENEQKIKELNDTNKKIQLENEEKINQINEENKKNLEKINDQNNKISEYEKINSEQKKKLDENKIEIENQKKINENQQKQLLENLQRDISNIKGTAKDVKDAFANVCSAKEFNWESKYITQLKNLLFRTDTKSGEFFQKLKNYHTNEQKEQNKLNKNADVYVPTKHRNNTTSVIVEKHENPSEIANLLGIIEDDDILKKCINSENLNIANNFLEELKQIKDDLQKLQTKISNYEKKELEEINNNAIIKKKLSIKKELNILQNILYSAPKGMKFEKINSAIESITRLSKNGADVISQLFSKLGDKNNNNDVITSKDDLLEFIKYLQEENNLDGLAEGNNQTIVHSILEYLQEGLKGTNEEIEMQNIIYQLKNKAFRIKSITDNDEGYYQHDLLNFQNIVDRKIKKLPRKFNYLKNKDSYLNKNNPSIQNSFLGKIKDFELRKISDLSYEDMKSANSILKEVHNSMDKLQTMLTYRRNIKSKSNSYITIINSLQDKNLDLNKKYEDLLSSNAENSKNNLEKTISGLQTLLSDIGANLTKKIEISKDETISKEDIIKDLNLTQLDSVIKKLKKSSGDLYKTIFKEINGEITQGNFLATLDQLISNVNSIKMDSIESKNDVNLHELNKELASINENIIKYKIDALLKSASKAAETRDSLQDMLNEEVEENGIDMAKQKLEYTKSEFKGNIENVFKESKKIKELIEEDTDAFQNIAKNLELEDLNITFKNIKDTEAGKALLNKISTDNVDNKTLSTKDFNKFINILASGESTNTIISGKNFGEKAEDIKQEVSRLEIENSNLEKFYKQLENIHSDMAKKIKEYQEQQFIELANVFLSFETIINNTIKKNNQKGFEQTKTVKSNRENVNKDFTSSVKSFSEFLKKMLKNKETLAKYFETRQMIQIIKSNIEGIFKLLDDRKYYDKNKSISGFTKSPIRSLNNEEKKSLMNDLMKFRKELDFIFSKVRDSDKEAFTFEK